MFTDVLCKGRLFEPEKQSKVGIHKKFKGRRFRRLDG
jgi:hypothetical protein